MQEKKTLHGECWSWLAKTDTACILRVCILCFMRAIFNYLCYQFLSVDGQCRFYNEFNYECDAWENSMSSSGGRSLSTPRQWWRSFRWGVGMVDGGASGATYAIVFAAPINKNGSFFVVYEPNKHGNKNVNDHVVKLMYSVKIKYKNRNTSIDTRAASIIHSSCRHLLFSYATRALIWVAE